MTKDELKRTIIAMVWRCNNYRKLKLILSTVMSAAE